MFDNIAGAYDTLNHTLTFGMDIWWRRRAISMLRPYEPKVLVDMATGTGDFALAARRINPEKVIGIDLSPGMLEIGRKKMKEKGADQLIDMVLGDSEAIQMDDNTVDAMTVGFGVRNFENLKLGLSEMRRVLKPGKPAVILEPSFPTTFPLKQLFQFYFRFITPLVGRFVSGDDAAYTYLPESVKAFPHGEEFLEICREVGYKKVKYVPLTGGICALYLLEK
ncbi:MAG: bifunctional demethylmenaquinone methyltransferase/2-methoxy-6-polyprenyl-1,4-benzoquinol methylase UbiE [Bacteroidia bacterium]|nr:bifunctional demethylmenaquinone methyltransferase/2-methoxy-6-polyprenyl-1,4-benzoquinol methylase UbiE [Bacteroidia bacterium]